MSAESTRGVAGPVSRRRFLAGVGAVTSVVVGGHALDLWSPAPAAASSAKPTLGDGIAGRTLVVVELGGGNDGLNTVVPHADPAYRTLRPTLGVTDAIDLDGQIGLDPRLAKLAARYAAGQVAIVEGVGYPDPDLSHFASMAVWWSADPDRRGGSGWLGRYLDGTVGFDDPLAGIVIGTGPSPALLGDASFATSIGDARGLQPALPAWIDRPDDLVTAWSRFAPATSGSGTLTDDVERAIRLTAAARREIDRDLSGTAPSARTPGAARPADAADAASAASAATTAVVDDLTLAARLVAADEPPRVVYVATFGDFDTHQGEAQRHPLLMQQLDAGIDAFFTTVEAAGVGERAVLMTTSEFGRRAAENGGGTDHGTAAPHFVVGAKVKGGRYGQAPDLAKLDDDGNLALGVDLRTYFASLLQGWLGVDPEPVVGPGFAPLPLF